MKIRWGCLLSGHDWRFLHSDGDWLEGGSHHYECRRCGKPLVSTPLKGLF